MAVRNFTRVDRTIWPRADDVRVHGERAFAVVRGGIAAPRSHSDETYDRRLPDAATNVIAHPMCEWLGPVYAHHP